MKENGCTKTYILMGVIVLLLVAAGLLCGTVKIPVKDVLSILSGNYSGREAFRHIVLNSRLPQTITALLAGSSLAVSGLLLQTLFKNPLAGPSILGISDGASLGVAVAMLCFLKVNYVSTILAAFIGASVILVIIIWFARKVKNNVMLLIIGIMVGYLASSAISILNYRTTADKVHQYVMWGMGDFSSVSLEKLPCFVLFSATGLVMAVLLTKPLNALLLGEDYAASLGVNVRKARLGILVCTGILTASTTAFCGPVSFIGLAVPHIARLLSGSSNHRHLLPLTLLTGGVIALICNLLTTLPGENGVLPLNAVTPVIGAPVIIYVILNRRNIHYFN